MSAPKLPEKKSQANMADVASSHYSRPSSTGATLDNGVMNKQLTSKPLPPLPNHENPRPAAMIVMDPKWNANNGYREQICQVADDDENDDDECDYEYEYVCLESTKKLNEDDDKIKHLIAAKSMQSKYERLALNDDFKVNDSLNALEARLGKCNLKNVNIQSQIQARYK